MTEHPNHIEELRAGANTDRELWREREGDYYANSLHVTKDGAIGMNVGGRVIVKPLAEWHVLANTPTDSAYQHQAGENDLRETAIGLIVKEAEELGYCDDDVAGFRRGEFDGDDLLTLQAVERALRFAQHQASGFVGSEEVELHDPRVTALAEALFRAEHPNAEWLAGRARIIWFERAVTALRFAQQSAKTSEKTAREGVPSLDEIRFMRAL